MYGVTQLDAERPERRYHAEHSSLYTSPQDAQNGAKTKVSD